MDILKKLIISEKASALNDSGVYGFIVNIKANKVQLKKEIEKLYQVKVRKVNTMIYPRQKKVKYTKKRVLSGKISLYKKALIYLKKGQVLDVYKDI